MSLLASTTRSSLVKAEAAGRMAGTLPSQALLPRAAARVEHWASVWHLQVAAAAVEETVVGLPTAIKATALRAIKARTLAGLRTATREAT